MGVQWGRERTFAYSEAANETASSGTRFRNLKGSPNRWPGNVLGWHRVFGINHEACVKDSRNYPLQDSNTRGWLVRLLAYGIYLWLTRALTRWSITRSCWDLTASPPRFPSHRDRREPPERAEALGHDIDLGPAATNWGRATPDCTPPEQIRGPAGELGCWSR